MSSLRPILASIIQSSAIGPASYVVNASDLHAVTDGNELCKYADDTYIIIPAVNVGSHAAELRNIIHTGHIKIILSLIWQNSGDRPLIFVDKRRKANFSAPAIIPELQRVQVLRILGVTLTNGLSVSLHDQNVITTCSNAICAACLRAHNLCDNALQIIYRAVI